MQVNNKTKTKKLIVANWKMNPTTEKEAVVIAKKISTNLKLVKNKNSVIICPPVIYLKSLRAISKSILLGAQTMSSELSGAHTGEISSSMIRSLGASYVILGHSEVRARGEENTVVAQKIALALKSKLIPILCVGEKVRDTSGTYLHEVREQLVASLVGITKNVLSSVVIAYEPVWAIGKDATRAPTVDEVREMTLFIKKTLAEIAKSKTILSTPVLYGGSVDENNALELSFAGIDGLLVGRASLDPKKFAKICSI